VAWDFEYNGGVYKPQTHQLEKFLLFGVVGGKEVPLYQLIQIGLVQKGGKAFHYVSLRPGLVLKIFIADQGFGAPKRFCSFYFKLMEPPAPSVKVVPFSGDTSGYYFKGVMTLLKKKEVLSLLNEDCRSRQFVKTQRLPIEVARKLIKVDTSEMRKGVRRIRIRKGG